MSEYPISIIYNGIDAFYPQPTPYIGLAEQNIYADELWGKAETMTLQGNLTGCTYDKIVEAQRDLFSRFSKPFQTLEVWQNLGGGMSGKVFQKELVEVQSIDITQGRWYGVQPYTVTLTCYPSGLFSGAYGILNPSDDWAFAEQENATLAVTHTISCQPFNTSSGPSNALDNARNWAFQRTGVNSWVYPILISGVSPDNFCLLTQAETIDRFNGTYSLTETYTNDLARSGYGVIRYSTDIISGDNVIQVNLNGLAQGCQRNLTGTRAALARIDMTAVALKQYQSAFNRTDLNPTPTAQSFNENPFTAEIGFSYSYDNSNLPSVWFDYEVGLNVGTNGFIEADIAGTVYARGGDVASKLARTTAYASGVNLYNLVLPYYNGFDASSVVPLNPVPVQSSKGINETNGTVQLSATYNNRTATESVLDQFNASIAITPSLAQVDAQPVLNGRGTYSVVNLRYGSRGSISINGNAVINRNASAAAGEAAVKNAAYALFGQYGSSSRATLDVSQTEVSRTDDRVVNFNYVWSFGPTNIVGPTSIGSLSV
jgi:hypothetical protein